jgi:hypothetical protein
MDPLAAALAIPGALKSTIEIIEKLTRTTRADDTEAKSNLTALSAQVSLMRESVVNFSYVTVALRPWKHAHHCTNLIIHTEMTVLFKMEQEETYNKVKNDPKSIQIELNKSDLHVTSLNYIRSFSAADLQIEIPGGLKSFVDTQTWHDFIISSIEELRDSFQKRDAKRFYRTLHRYKQFVIPLNDAADRQLLLGLQKIAERLDALRAQLAPPEVKG